MVKKILLFILLAVCVFPAAIMVYNSFLDIDGGFSLTQYGALLCNVRFFRAFWNSVGYTFVILVFSLPISLTAAYGFS